MANIKSYATLQLQFLGYPPGVYPQVNGEFVPHVYRGYYFRPPDYVCAVAYEQANRAQSDFPKMYQILDENATTIGGAVDLLQEKLTEAQAKIAELEEKLEKKRHPGRPRKDETE